MSELSNNAKKELREVLDGDNETMFVSDGKLFSLEVQDMDFTDEKYDNLTWEIEAYPELKESLQHYLNNPGMKRYTAKELKELRNEQRS